MSLESLRQSEAAAQQAALAAYAELVQRFADGGDADEATARHVLQRAGKSVDDLARDVDRIRDRIRLRAQVVAGQQAAEERDRIARRLSEERDAFAEARRQHEARLTEIGGSIDDQLARDRIVSEGASAKRELVRSYPEDGPLSIAVRDVRASAVRLGRRLHEINRANARDGRPVDAAERARLEAAIAEAQQEEARLQDEMVLA